MKKTTREHIVCLQDDNEIVLTASDNTQVSRTTAIRVDGKILESPVLFNLLKAAKQSTFQDYMLVLPSIKSSQRDSNSN